MRFFITCLFLIAISSSSIIFAQDFPIKDLNIFIEENTSKVMEGELYEVTIGLNQELPKDYAFSVRVNGRSLPIKNDKARYTAKSYIAGEKKCQIMITIRKSNSDGVQIIAKNISYQVMALERGSNEREDKVSSTKVKMALPLPEQLDIMVEAENSEILLGEQYRATISLNEELPKDYSFGVSVGGSSLLVTNNQSLYVASSMTVGRKYYTVSVRIKNAEQETIKTLSKKIAYRIKTSDVSVLGTKMNVLFVGVDNPIVVTTSDIAPKNLQVSISGATIKYKSSGHYVVTCQKTGQVTIIVRDIINGKSYPFKFRVKRMPDPVVKLGKLGDATLSKEALDNTLASFSKGAIRLTAWLENFDFEARCEVTSFSFLHYRKGKIRAVEVFNKGAVLQFVVKTALEKARPGDLFLFTEIKGTCPMDEEERALKSLVFRIKA